MEINGRILIFSSVVCLFSVYEEVAFRFGKD